MVNQLIHLVKVSKMNMELIIHSSQFNDTVMNKLWLSLMVYIAVAIIYFLNHKKKKNDHKQYKIN